MKDFPLNELIPATELSKTTKAIVSILSHLKKVNKNIYSKNLSTEFSENE
jgi:hypothetical protein